MSRSMLCPWQEETYSHSSTWLALGVEVTINEDSDTNKELITSSTSDSAGRLLPAKVLASQLLYNFDELARPFDDFPVHLMGDIIEDTPKTDSVNLPFGNGNFCIVSLPSVIPVS
eukprot:15354285-Ditylum_brightwellii.AAC.1